MSLSYWDYLTLLLLRPLFAIAVVILFISSGWWLAWKLVLVHVPLVQEIFGLRKKAVKAKPPTGRISKIYSTIEARNQLRNERHWIEVKEREGEKKLGR